MLKPKLITLPSGLRLVLVHMPGSLTATVEVMVETGSKYESEKEAGLSHFLEHMCFKGTEKRPTSLDISREFDELGAVSNAFTATEVTGYYAKAESKKLPQLMDIVADIYLNSVFRDEDVQKEKGVIIEEINMYEDQPQAVVAEVFESAMHGAQAAGRPVIGSKETVSSFTAEDFYAYRKKHYVAEATTVVVSGDFDEKRIVALAKVLFKDISRARKSGKKKTATPKTGAKIALKKKDTDQMHLILGVRSYPYGSKQGDAIAVLRSVLSGGMSSRLWHRLRDDLGICYYVSAGNNPSTDHGEFGVSAGVDPKRADEAVRAIMQELRRTASELVPAGELKKATTSMVSKMYMSLESSDAVADWFADRAIFLRDLRTPKQREADIMKVSAQDVRAAAKSLFSGANIVLAAVGRDPDEASLKKALVL